MESLAAIKGNDKYKGIYINKTSKGKTYYIKYRDEHGKTVRKSLKHIDNITDKMAHDELEDAKAKIRNIKKNMPVIPKKRISHFKTLNEMADFYFTNNEFKSKQGEMHRYNWHCRNEEFATKLFELITVEELNDFRDKLKKTKPRNINDVTSTKTLSPKSIKNIFTLCISIVRFAINEGKYKGYNPFATVKKPEVNNVKLKVMTEKEVELFFEKLKTADIRNPEYQVSYLYGVLGLTLGAREQTILNIKISDVNFEAKTIALYNFKTETEYTGHIISEDVEKAIQNVIDYWENIPIQEDSEYLFRVLKTGYRYKKAPNGVRNTLDKYINHNRQEDKKVIVRDLRNVFATRLINKGIPLAFIQNLLSHKTPEMTTRYARLLENTGGNELKESFKEMKF